jgi:SOS response regulatory protein OraA/RecX
MPSDEHRARKLKVAAACWHLASLSNMAAAATQQRSRRGHGSISAQNWQRRIANEEISNKINEEERRSWWAMAATKAWRLIDWNDRRAKKKPQRRNEMKEAVEMKAGVGES